ncbi:MAG TPA: nucleotidyltransferase domain-containing protein [Thermoanaerobaculia bacterium]|nr:nucleotidyltransferase domain-containing protein [Thermoanaerobaculia bacterium]
MNAPASPWTQDRVRPASPLVRQMTEQFAAKLRERFGERVLSIRLFGSFAKGGAHEHSDIDVAVVFDRLDWPTKREAIELAIDVEQESGFAISLMPTVFDRAKYELWREQERALVRDIENEGIPL